YFQKALAVDPRSVEAHCLLALGMENRGQFDEAERHLTKAVDLDPGYTTARLALGRARLRRKDVEGARRHFAEAVRRDPRRADAQAALAQALESLGRFKDAAAAARQGLRLAEAGRQTDLAQQLRQLLDSCERRLSRGE